jgi:hypothetical protein
MSNFKSKVDCEETSLLFFYYLFYCLSNALKDLINQKKLEIKCVLLLCVFV